MQYNWLLTPPNTIKKNYIYLIKKNNTIYYNVHI